MRNPRLPLGPSAARVPQSEMSKGAADRWGMAAAFPPDALPQRAVATRRRPQQRLTIRLVPSSNTKLSVRKRTPRLPLREFARLPPAGDSELSSHGPNNAFRGMREATQSARDIIAEELRCDRAVPSRWRIQITQEDNTALQTVPIWLQSSIHSQEHSYTVYVRWAPSRARTWSSNGVMRKEGSIASPRSCASWFPSTWMSS